MNLFLAFVILLNAAALIAAGYLLWRADDYLERYISDAIRKQDDRIRKRQGAANGVSQETSSDSETAGPVGGETPDTSRTAKRRQIGRPYRP